MPFLIELPSDWSESLTIGVAGDPIITIHKNNIAYVFLAEERSAGASIVIKTEPGKLFSCFTSEDAKLEALRRSVQAGILACESGGELPEYWRPYSGGKFITFQAQPLSKLDQRRLAMWRRNNDDGTCAYIFAVTSSQKEYDKLQPDMNFLARALYVITAKKGAHT